MALLKRDVIERVYIPKPQTLNPKPQTLNPKPHKAEKSREVLEPADCEARCREQSTCLFFWPPGFDGLEFRDFGLSFYLKIGV